MKTIAEEWIDYRNASYPNGLSERQEMEAEQAFYGGAMAVLIKTTDEIPALPLKKMNPALQKLSKEIYGHCLQLVRNFNG